MNTITLLFQFIFIFSIAAQTLTPPAALPLLQQGRGFQNATGSGMTYEQIASFITYAKYASLIYGDDVEKVIKYIKLRMDAQHGLQVDNYYIYIQTDQAATSRYLWVSVPHGYASLNGINPLYPNWSYLFQRSYGNKNIPEYSFFGTGKKGRGITKQFEDYVRSLILAYETTDTCQCTRQLVENISKGIQVSIAQLSSWTVFCDDKGVTSALIKTFDQKYLGIKAKNCYYTIFNYI